MKTETYMAEMRMDRFGNDYYSVQTNKVRAEMARKLSAIVSLALNGFSPYDVVQKEIVLFDVKLTGSQRFPDRTLYRVEISCEKGMPSSVLLGLEEEEDLAIEIEIAKAEAMPPLEDLIMAELNKIDEVCVF